MTQEPFMWTVLTIISTAVAFVSFAWGVRGHFQVEGRLPPAMQALSAFSLLAFASFLWIIVRHGVPPGRAMATVVLATAATGLFWWAVSTTRTRPPAVAHQPGTPTMVHDAGPYALVRHPFYLSYSMLWLGTALAADGLQWVFALVLIGWYYVTARAEEERFEASAIAGPYARYKARTGMIIPKIFGRGG
jgi:protein-S-isoprenylcysteine O-methyltransferase Ste14